MAEKQLTTIEQLRALAERGKQDTLIRINELLDFFKLRPGSTAVSCYCLLQAKDRSVPAHLAFLLYHIVPIFSRGHVHGVLLCVVEVQYILNS